ncbi:MAG TPA: glycosyltransferase [Actinomycetota bacterium]|nr:glycosyltransferase [Actinomycetota bacterium]
MPDLSIVVPAYNEGSAIVACLDQIVATVATPFEVLVVYDTPEDTTAPFVASYARADPRVRPALNTYGRGPAQAIRFGLEHAQAPIAVVTMADGSDEARLIDEMARLVAEGAAVVAASRYMRGGRQIGGPPLKRTLSRLAGVSLYWLGRVGTHDATSAFKAYSTAFVREARIESDRGFEIGLELVGKAKHMGRRVAEVPTTWRDRTEGASNFRVAAWLPTYLRWYWRALRPARDRGAGG